MCFIYIPILSQRHRICILIFRNYTHRQHKFLSAINFNLPSSMNSPPFDSNLVRFPNLWWHSTSTYRHLPMGGFRGRYIPNWLIWYRHIIQTSSLAIYIRPKHTWQYFYLQVRSIAQNVGSAIGLPVDITYFRWQFWWKSSPRPQNFVTLQTFYLFNIAPIRYQKWKDHVQIMREKYFSWWWRHWWRHSVTTKSAFYIHV